MDRPDEGRLIADAGQAAFSLLVLGDTALIGDEHGGIHEVDLRNKREVRLEQAHRHGVFALLRLPDGRVAAAGGDGALSLWDISATSLALVRRIPLCAEKLRALALAPDGRSLAVAAGDGTVHVLDTTDLNERYTLHAHPPGATAVAWHPRKPVLLSGGKDGHLRAWRSDRDFGPLMDLPAHGGTIYAIAFDGNGTRLATTSRDKTAKVWDAGTLGTVARLDRKAGGHSHSVNCALWIGPTLITAGDDRQVIAWEALPEAE